MPNFANPQAVMKYSATVRAQLAARLGQNPNPPRSIAGIARNIGSDGRTYQNVASM